jgi:hypothetical protein
VWGLWLERNDVTFQGKEIPTIHVIHQTRNNLEGNPHNSCHPAKSKQQIILKAPKFNKDVAWCFLMMSLKELHVCVELVAFYLEKKIILFYSNM